MITHWIKAARPQTLPAGIAPVLLGLSLSQSFLHAAGLTLNTTVAIITMITTMLLQISSNLINDYYDGVSGADNETRLGPERMVSLGFISAVKMKKGFMITLALAFFLGLYLMNYGGLPIIVIGLSSLFFSWAYTGGPYPLSYYALGEVFALIFFGPVAVWGTYYLQTKNASLDQTVLLWGIAIGLISSALMGINNLRDHKQDRKAHKITMATLLGHQKMRVTILFMLIISTVIAIKLSTHAFYYGFVPFILFYKNGKNIMIKSGRDLNNVLAMTGRYLFVFALFFSGLILL